MQSDLVCTCMCVLNSICICVCVCVLGENRSEDDHDPGWADAYRSGQAPENHWGPLQSAGLHRALHTAAVLMHFQLEMKATSVQTSSLVLSDIISVKTGRLNMHIT